MKMEMPPKTCICGCSFETGVKIIGWFGIVSNTLLLMRLGAFIYELSEAERKLSVDTNLANFVTVLYWVMAFVIVNFMFHVILLLGVHLKKPSLVLAFIIMVRFCITITVFTFIQAMTVVDVVVMFTITICLAYYVLIHYVVDTFRQTMFMKDEEALIAEA